MLITRAELDRKNASSGGASTKLPALALLACEYLEYYYCIETNGALEKPFLVWLKWFREACHWESVMFWRSCSCCFDSDGPFSPSHRESIRYCFWSLLGSYEYGIGISFFASSVGTPSPTFDKKIRQMGSGKSHRLSHRGA